MKQKVQYSSGYAVVEILIASFIISISLFGLLATSEHFLQVSRETNRNVQANYLLQEGVEALRSMRDESYSAHISSLASDTTYYLYWNGSAWRATTTIQAIGEFTRSFTASAVSRDATDDIVTSGGTSDSHTKKIDISVFWTNSNHGTTSKALSTYITNYFQ